MIEYMGRTFNSFAELNEWNKAGHIDYYKKLASMAANNPTMELITIMRTEADTLHNQFGLTWCEIEEIEIAAMQTA